MRKETASRQVCTGAWYKEKSKGKMNCRAHLASLTLPWFWPGDWRTERGFSSKIRQAEFICEAYRLIFAQQQLFTPVLTFLGRGWSGCQNSSFLSGCKLQGSSILNPATQSEPFPISSQATVNEKNWCDSVAVFFPLCSFSKCFLYTFHFHRPLIAKASCCTVSIYLSLAFR